MEEREGDSVGEYYEADWSFYTPDISCASDSGEQQVTPGDLLVLAGDEREGDGYSESESSPPLTSVDSPAAASDEEMLYEIRTPSQPTDSLSGGEGEEVLDLGLPYSHPDWSSMKSTGPSPPVLLTQPNFDDLSSSESGTGDVSLSSVSPAHTTSSSAYYTLFSSSLPSASVYNTAAEPPPSSPSHILSSPSPQTLSPSRPSPCHTLSPSPPHSIPSRCLTTPPPESPPHSLPSSHISIESSSPPQSHTLPRNTHSSPIIILDSSDEEDADSKLENLFANMRLQSEKKKTASAKIPSRRSLSEFIVRDSEEESEEEDDQVVHIAVESTSSKFRTPSGPPLYHPVSSLTPCTPHGFLTSRGTPGEISPPLPDHSMTAPARRVHSRRPLTQRNHSPHTPGIRTEVRAKAPVTTPSAAKTFGRHKKTMAQELYNLFSHSVFTDQLPSDMELVWNSKLRTTAGFCRNSGLMSDRRSQIELSTKVIDSYERLKNTLIHEMCHAAVWIINGIKHGAHKRHWRAWASKANSVHPDLDPITRCHSYDISYKFHYNCTRCDYKLGRHSKSVNLTEARCPYCRSALKLEEPPTAKLNRYAQFVKDNYAEVKLRTPVGGHKVVMEKLRQKYYTSCTKTPAPE